MYVTNSIDQNGFPQPPLQGYAGNQWLWVRPFALSRIDENKPWIDPGPPPFLGTATDAEFKENLVAVIRASSQLTRIAAIDISRATENHNTVRAMMAMLRLLWLYSSNISYVGISPARSQNSGRMALHPKRHLATGTQ
jgi:hypothetical protein